MALREVECEDEWWNKLAQDRFILSSDKFRVLQYCYDKQKLITKFVITR